MACRSIAIICLTSVDTIVGHFDIVQYETVPISFDFFGATVRQVGTIAPPSHFWLGITSDWALQPCRKTDLWPNMVHRRLDLRLGSDIED